MFNTQDIADYYNQTLNHYARWWKLDQSLSVHYGLWDKHTTSFQEALINTNVTMAKVGNIQPNMRVLDAGCGVGGAAFYLAEHFNCRVTGITLGDGQLAYAQAHLKESPYEHLVNFDKQDFTHTNFEAHSFDVIWRCESLCYAHPKEHFVAEALRLLKPGGKLIMADYFLTEAGEIDEYSYIKKWGDTWAITSFNTTENLINVLVKNSFSIDENLDFTTNIYPSAKRMYSASLLGALPAMVYNLTHNTSRFAKTHYLSGIYQYKALQKRLWTYRVVSLTKAHTNLGMLV
jgi:ubiquinone/menaquinone biosynthesis C-methylase UbiE